MVMTKNGIAHLTTSKEIELLKVRTKHNRQHNLANHICFVVTLDIKMLGHGIILGMGIINHGEFFASIVEHIEIIARREYAEFWANREHKFLVVQFIAYANHTSTASKELRLIRTTRKVIRKSEVIALRVIIQQAGITSTTPETYEMDVLAIFTTI